MNRAHVIRMYPTKDQAVLLKKAAGTARYVYNWALAKWMQMYKDYTEGTSTEKPTVFLLDKIWTTEKPAWAYETHRSAQNRAILQVGSAFKNMFRGNCRKPRFKKKSYSRQSFYTNNVQTKLYGHVLTIPKIGKIKLAEELRFSGKIMGFTISSYADRWYVSVQIHTSKDVRPVCANIRSSIGIDVGLHHIAVSSNGDVLDTPESINRLETQLKTAQRRLARSEKGSRNREKALIKKQKIQNRINNIRKDITHKFTTAITKSHGVVVTEDLNIQEIKDKATHRSFRRSFNKSCMGMILSQISYKSQVHLKVDRYFPSTKLCSVCGNIQEMPPEVRTYECKHCGSTVDRDLNAAINICQAGMVDPRVPVESVYTH